MRLFEWFHRKKNLPPLVSGKGRQVYQGNMAAPEIFKTGSYTIDWDGERKENPVEIMIDPGSQFNTGSIHSLCRFMCVIVLENLSQAGALSPRTPTLTGEKLRKKVNNEFIFYVKTHNKDNYPQKPGIDSSVEMTFLQPFEDDLKDRIYGSPFRKLFL
jgi:hypothetical protein